MTDHELMQLSEIVGLSRLSNAGRPLPPRNPAPAAGVAKAITDIAGSSAWFERGFVTYSNEAKAQMIGVRESTLEQHGAVSEPVVIEMAIGALKEARPARNSPVRGFPVRGRPVSPGSTRRGDLDDPLLLDLGERGEPIGADGIGGNGATGGIGDIGDEASQPRPAQERP